MKKLLCTFVLVIALFTLSACMSGGNDENVTEPEPTASVTPTAEPTPTAEAVATPVPTSEPEPTPSPTPVPDFKDVFDAAGMSGGYSVSTKFSKKLSGADINMVGDRIVLVGNDDYNTGYVYSINPDTFEYEEVHLNNCNGAEFKAIDDNTFAVQDNQSNRYYKFDAELNKLGVYDALNSYENSVFDADGVHLWYYNYDDAVVYRRNCEDENEEIENVFTAEFDGGSGYINNASNKDYLVIDMYSACDAPDGNFIYDIAAAERIRTDGRQCIAYENPERTRCILSTSIPYYKVEVFDCGLRDIFTENADGEMVAGEAVSSINLNSTGETYIMFPDWDNNVLITSNTSYGDRFTVFTVRCYSLETGEKIAQYDVETSASGFWPALTYDKSRNILFFTVNQNGELKLYAWDYMNDSVDDSLDAYRKNTYIPDYINERRDAFEKKYDLKMYLGSEVFASDFDYRLTICTDWDMVEEAMDKLEEVFSLYPDGFFDQMKMGGIMTQAIYLCNGFEKIYDYSADDAIALACTFGYERALALDLGYNYCLKSTIVHEVSHWIDTRIESMSLFGKCVNYEDDWLTYLPDDFTYKYSYVSGKTKWGYIFGYGNDANVYYADEYSQTYPGEDRARCFEYLMYPEETGDREYMSAPHLREKLHFYFDTIREAFDDTDWPEETTWEIKLREADERYAPAEAENSAA